ncbi:MAG: aminodeoxychorismate synthase component I [Candidatus Firestonebacteria bacterium]
MNKKYYKLPDISSKYIKSHNYFFLYETGLCHDENFTSYIFTEPIFAIKVNDFKDVNKAFENIDKYSKKYYLVGFFSYELGYFFEKDSFKVKSQYSFPLIYLCVFDRVISFNHITGRVNGDVKGVFNAGESNDFKINKLKLNISKSDYEKKIKDIKEYIKSGDTYQVNFTSKFKFDFKGEPFSFYQDLKSRQNVPYSAFCKFKDQYVISLSPELYFRKEGQFIYSRPMKGTIKRGKNIDEDKEKIVELKNSIKNRAENIMIVDLIRNDLGRISEIGSIKVSKLFQIEKYNTLFQMTSLVKGVLKKDITYYEIFKNIFPGGSVTGAPKIRTMQIIKKLEVGPRNVYCGALGIIFPGDKAIFNLPIRTIYLRGNYGEMGIGSGIVYDSNPLAEYDECILKAKFLTERCKDFELLETILWDKKYLFLKEHLNRLEKSARYFDFYFNKDKIITGLKKLEGKFKKGTKIKIRLLLNKEGNFKIEDKLIKDNALKEKKMALSKYKVDSENIFLYHKTTNRELFNSEYEYYSKKGFYDVLFLNKKNEVTEGAISNIFIKKDGKFYTPPISSGLLPGIYREYFIKKSKAIEKVLYLKDLDKADKILLCNSVKMGIATIFP